MLYNSYTGAYYGDKMRYTLNYIKQWYEPATLQTLGTTAHYRIATFRCRSGLLYGLTFSYAGGDDAMSTLYVHQVASVMSLKCNIEKEIVTHKDALSRIQHSSCEERPCRHLKRVGKSFELLLFSSYFCELLVLTVKNNNNGDHLPVTINTKKKKILYFYWNFFNCLLYFSIIYIFYRTKKIYSF